MPGLVREDLLLSNPGLTAAIAAVRDQFDITVADSPALRRDAFQLRHQVYCLERGYEPGLGDIETDAFDSQARHVLLRHRATGEVLGTVRIVLAVPNVGYESFPMQQACAPGLLKHLPLAGTGEISRFAISKDRRHVAGPAAALMRLGLVQGLVRVSRDEGITHWCAVMERTLLRLLQSSGIHFEPLGPLIEYHGIRQPAACHLGSMLARMQREQPLIWSLLTQDGTLCARSGSVPHTQHDAMTAAGHTATACLELA
jgi:N-acyl-L-homoserine lactone synthetase